MEAQIPTPTKINGKLYFERVEFENYKRQLIGWAPLERDPQAPIELVPATQAAAELGRHRRTIGRRILAAARSRALATGAAA